MKTTRRLLGASILAIAAMGLAVWVGCSSDTTPPPGGGTADAAPDSNGGGDSAVPDAGHDSTTSDAGGDSTELDGGSDSLSDTGPVVDSSDAAPGKEVIYSNAGASLNVFAFNANDGTLTAQPTLTQPLPAGVLQFAAFDSMQKYFYVAAGNPAPGYLSAFSINQATGALTQIGAVIDGGAADGGNTQSVLDPNGRVVNLTLSRDDRYLLTVHPLTKAYTVFSLQPDGTIGAVVPQPMLDAGADAAPIDTSMNIGAYIHQIRVAPSNMYATICDRGNDPSVVTAPDGGVSITPEDLGHLRTFTYANGVLTALRTITFPSGVGPRHLDFHPTQPWVYVAAERGNRLITYSFQNGTLTQQDNQTSVFDPANAGAPNTEHDVNGPRAGAIMVHPSGKYLWITNRDYQIVPYTPDGGADAGSTLVWDGKGENNLVLFSIDQTTGVPTKVSAAPSHGFEPATFALDPSGRYVIVGNKKQVNVLTSTGSVTTVNPNLSVFQVGGDGTLTFVKSYDQAGEIFWVGGKGVTGP